MAYSLTKSQNPLGTKLGTKISILRNLFCNKDLGTNYWLSRKLATSRHSFPSVAAKVITGNTWPLSADVVCVAKVRDYLSCSSNSSKAAHPTTSFTSGNERLTRFHASSQGQELLIEHLVPSLV